MSDKDCDCDDGIGMYVCKRHSTPNNDVFHYVFHARRDEEESVGRPGPSEIEAEERARAYRAYLLGEDEE